MALVSFLLFLFFSSFHLLPLFANSADCPPSFPCGGFDLEFPFTVTSSPGCGLITVDGCDHPQGPKNISGSWFTILEKIDPNKFLVQDSTLEGFLRNRSCLFIRNLTVPQAYPLSFTYLPNITVFTCFNKSLDEGIHDYFSSYSSINNSNTIDCRSDFSTIYYRSRTAGTRESAIPTECLMMQLPVISGADSDDLLPILTSNFTLEWNVPEGCSRSKSGNEYDCDEGRGTYNCILLSSTEKV